MKIAITKNKHIIINKIVLIRHLFFLSTVYVVQVSLLTVVAVVFNFPSSHANTSLSKRNFLQGQSLISKYPSISHVLSYSQSQVLVF